MTWESNKRRAARRRRKKLRGQPLQRQDPGNLCTHRAKEAWLQQRANNRSIRGCRGPIGGMA
jgi:hypothetical protein